MQQQIQGHKNNEGDMNMCNHELKRLYYTSDDDYDILTCKVSLERNEDKYTLSYCEKCGQVFVKEIAEKMMEEE